jgi:hypothetical protein
MADGATLTIDDAQLRADGDRTIRRYLTAGTAAVAGATKRLERNLEAATRAAVPGRLWRAWASDAYPEKGPARNPVGEVFVNGRDRSRGAIQFWSQPGEVRGKAGQFLAIPLPAAGSTGRLRNLTPGEWERRTGKRLRFVYRQGRPSLLVLDDAVLSGRRQLARGNTARRIATGRASATVPIFVLLPLVRHRNTVAVGPLVQQAEREMVAEFLRGAGAINSG